MHALFHHLKLPVALVTAFSMTGCVSVDPAALTTLPGDIFAMRGAAQTLRSRPSSPHDALHKAHAAVAIITTVHRYASLTTIQKRRVEEVVERRYQGMVQKEKRTLAPRYNTRKAEVRKRGATKVSEARKKSPQAAAKAEAETKKEIEKVDLEWEKAAKTSVARNYGTDFAVPVQNPEGKAVVAFASVKDSGNVSVSNSSYEVEGAVVSSKTKISHSGKTYAVLDETVR